MVMAHALRLFSGQMRAGYPTKIRSRNCSHCRFLPGTTCCMRHLSRCCVVPVTMCCTGRPPRRPRHTWGVAAEGYAHCGYRPRNFLKWRGACGARSRRIGKSRTEAHTRAEHSLQLLCCSGLQTLRTAPRSVCHSQQTRLPNREVHHVPDRVRLKTPSPDKIRQ